MKIIINESQFINLFEAANLIDIYQKYYNNIPQDIFQKIIETDPTYNQEKKEKIGKYAKWLLNLYKHNKLKLEDLYKAKEYLTYFVKYKNVIEEKDINNYKTLTDLYATISTYMNNNIATSKSDEIRKIKEGAEKVYEDKQWIIIIPHTKEASCYYGKNTQWCTAADKSNNQFDYYNQQGPLFINIDKINNTKYQFHFETNSFMNEHDEPINYPIEHNCDLSEGALKWYQNNVEQAYKLTNIKYELFWNEYMPYSLVGQNNDIGFKLLEGDDNDYENEIAYGLICHGQSEANYLQTSLYKYDYCLINNIWNRKTLILKSNNGELFTYGSHIKNVTTVKNMYSDDDMTLLMVTDDENTLEIIYNNGYTIYKNTNANLIQDAEHLTYDSLKINKTNDLCDVVLINTETPYIDLKDAYQNDEDMAEDTIHIVYTNGNKIKINTYNGEEIIE